MLGSDQQTTLLLQGTLVSAADQPSPGTPASVISSGTHSSPSPESAPSPPRCPIGRQRRLACVILGALTMSIQRHRNAMDDCSAPSDWVCNNNDDDEQHTCYDTHIHRRALAHTHTHTHTYTHTHK